MRKDARLREAVAAPEAHQLWTANRDEQALHDALVQLRLRGEVIRPVQRKVLERAIVGHSAISSMRIEDGAPDVLLLRLRQVPLANPPIDAVHSLLGRAQHLAQFTDRMAEVDESQEKAKMKSKVAVLLDQAV